MASVVRLLSALGFVAVMGLTLPAHAEGMKFPGTFSANAGIVTEYRFRGLDQSSQKPALQGGIDWSIDTGMSDTSVYLGTWGSNVDFGDSDKASAEIDYYGGIAGSYMGIGWDIGAIYYSYPGASDDVNYDLWEVALGLSYDVMDGLSIGANYAYSPDFFGASGKGHWITASASYAVPVDVLAGITLDASVGKQFIEKNSTFGQPDYVTWTIGASLGLTDNVSIGVQYIDTNISNSRLAEDVVIGTLSASF
jgi:uncharacterized protein (TIGR02001 family)